MNEKFKELLEENPYLYYNVYCQGELYERHKLPQRNCEYCGWNGARGEGMNLRTILKEMVELSIKDILWESFFYGDNRYHLYIDSLSEVYYVESDIQSTIDAVILDIISEAVDLDINMNIEDEIYYLQNKDIDVDLIKHALELTLEQ